MYRSKLFLRRDPYDLAGSEELFVAAVRESLRFHQQRCPPYAEILEQQGFDPASIRSIDDLHKIPPLPTLFLKSHSLFSIPYERLLFKSTSSGTGGKPSLAGLDALSAWHGFWMVWRSFAYHGLLSPRPTNYIVLGYQPSHHNQMGAVKTAYGATLAAPALHREYALKDTGSAYALNLDGIKTALLRYQKQGHPVRFMGFPAYFWFVLEMLEEEGIRLQLHPKSKVLLAGGWKQFAGQEVDKTTLYRRSEELLGIPEAGFQDFYGAVEHPILYCDCKHHHFHLPIYSRVIVRDVKTLAPLPKGQAGLLNLISPLVGSMPLTSVITDDLGILHHAEECGCGIPSPWFELLGRAGLSDIKTCAANAAELLEVSK